MSQCEIIDLDSDVEEVCDAVQSHRAAASGAAAAPAAAGVAVAVAAVANLSSDTDSDDDLLTQPFFARKAPAARPAAASFEAGAKPAAPRERAAAAPFSDAVIDGLDEGDNDGEALASSPPGPGKAGLPIAARRNSSYSSGSSPGGSSSGRRNDGIEDLLDSLAVCSQSPDGKARSSLTKPRARRQGLEKGTAWTTQAAAKAANAAAKAAEKAAKAAAAKEAKEEKKLQREQERAIKKRQREEQKAQEKADKQRYRYAAQAARGKFSEREVTCVFESRLAAAAEDALPLAAGMDPTRERFEVARAECSVRGAVWWTHRGVLAGGAAAAGEGVRVLDILAVVCPAEALLEALEVRAPPPNCYPRLGQLAADARAKLPGFSRLVLVMHGVGREISSRWRRHGAGGDAAAAAGGEPVGEPAALAAPEEAAAWLLVHLGVETRRTETDEDLGQLLWDTTRALAGAAYAEEGPGTALSVVQKLKTVDSAGDRGSAASAWRRQLRMIPGMSEMRVMSLASHYPTMRSLLDEIDAAGADTYRVESTVADKLGGANRQLALARRIVRFFTATDPDEEI